MNFPLSIQLKAKRKAKGYTQYDMADMLNISQGTYAGYERGAHKPDVETLVKIADILETSTDVLLGRYTIRDMAADRTSKLKKDFEEVIDDGLDKGTKFGNNIKKKQKNKP